MNRLFAAVLLSAAVIMAAGCSSSSGNPPDVTPTNPTTGSLPGSSTGTPADAGGERRAVSAGTGHLPVPVRPLFLGHHRRHDQHPACQWPHSEPGRPERARRLVDHRADPHPLRWRAESRVVQRRDDPRVPGDGQQHDQGGLGLHTSADLRHRVHRGTGHRYRRRADDPRDQAGGTAAAFRGTRDPDQSHCPKARDTWCCSPMASRWPAARRRLRTPTTPPSRPRSARPSIRRIARR